MVAEVILPRRNLFQKSGAYPMHIYIFFSKKKKLVAEVIPHTCFTSATNFFVEVAKVISGETCDTSIAADHLSYLYRR